MYQDVYKAVITAQWLPGTISQDIITVLVSIALLVSVLLMRSSQAKVQIFVLSLLLYLFYGYGIYAIEQVYNQLYLLYIGIFAIAFWSLLSSLYCIKSDVLQSLESPPLLKNISIGFSLVIPLLFYTLWITQLLPLMHSGNKIEFTYSIYILDMAFILPALLVSAVMTMRKNRLGLVLMPILFIKAFTLLFSVGLGGLLKPYYGQVMPLGETIFYIGLSVLFLLLAIAYLVHLQIAQQR